MFQPFRRSRNSGRYKAATELFPRSNAVDRAGVRRPWYSASAVAKTASFPEVSSSRRTSHARTVPLLSGRKASVVRLLTEASDRDARTPSRFMRLELAFEFVRPERERGPAVGWKFQYPYELLDAVNS